MAHILEKILMTGRKFTLGIATLAAISFADCQKTSINTPDDITIDPKHVGMVYGKAVSAEISPQNEITFSGYEGAQISILKPNSENTGFRATSVSGGVYAIDNIPTGSYNVRGCGPRSKCDYEPAIVSSQQQYEVSDLVAAINRRDKEGIIYGKVKKQDGLPYANKIIELWDANRTDSGTFPARKEASTTTSSDGSYAFYFEYDEYYLKSPEGNLKVGNWSPIGYFDPIHIPEEENIKGPLINQEVTFIPF